MEVGIQVGVHCSIKEFSLTAAGLTADGLMHFVSSCGLFPMAALGAITPYERSVPQVSQQFVSLVLSHHLDYGNFTLPCWYRFGLQAGLICCSDSNMQQLSPANAIFS